MKALRIALGTLLVLAAVYGLGKLFVSELGGGARSTEPAGVLLAPPPGFAVEEHGEMSRPAAARALALLLAGQPAQRRLGVHFVVDGSERYWLVERTDAAPTVLTELLSGQSGTRVESTWRGGPGELERRLAWAAEHGGLEAPGLSPGQSHNLYH